RLDLFVEVATNQCGEIVASVSVDHGAKSGYLIGVTTRITRSPRAILHFNNHDSATRRASDCYPIVSDGRACANGDLRSSNESSDPHIGHRSKGAPLN
ncbi:hypothetical protein, partial [Roseiconus lacunae]|uniref:hypothetical protein n=1 Tax=Roseiconus lacunae TaxID=2605694 RepID=UPI001E4E2B9B